MNELFRQGRGEHLVCITIDDVVSHPINNIRSDSTWSINNVIVLSNRKDKEG